MCHEGNGNSSCQVAADTASCSYTFVKISQNLLELAGISLHQRHWTILDRLDVVTLKYKTVQKVGAPNFCQ